jgi:uncharacterized protein YceH (UPF0502 family)
MDFLLTTVEARVLGSLIEKEITTPDYYPLSLNALVNACNQKSNRDPAMSLDEESVKAAIRSLNDQGLAGPADTMDSRVTKYEHRLQEAFNFDRRETAVLCELFLRGPQTPGELRARCERMHKFDDLSEIQLTLERLIKREPALVKLLVRQPGTKESRYAHLFFGDVDPHVTDGLPAEPGLRRGPVAEESLPEKVKRLESELAALRQELGQIRGQFSDFKKLFQ